MAKPKERARRPGRRPPEVRTIRAHHPNRFSPPLTISRPEFISDGVDERFRNVIYSMVLGLQRLAACREAFGSYLGLTGSQFAVLMGAAYCQGRKGVTIKALADHVLLAATHVTTEVNRLIRMNLLSKRPNSDDRRSVLVCLTPLGEDAVRAVTPIVRGVNDALFRGISARELECTGRVLKSVAHNGEEALSEARAARWNGRVRRPAAHRRRRTGGTSAV